MTPHSPSPWRITLPNSHHKPVHIFSGNVVIARVFSQALGMTHEEKLANARLMAAAPCLLEACEALLGRVGTWEEAQAKAEQAIKKAKGI